MNIALTAFEGNIERARALVRLYAHLSTRTTAALDISDILRAALVQGVSALDQYVHEVTRIGMIETHQGKRMATRAFLAFPISLTATRSALSNPADTTWLSESIQQAHGWQTFQRPDKIADALRLVSDSSLWECVAAELGADTRRVKVELQAIVDRRNKIAHEADMDPSYPGQRWPISESLVQGALDFLDKLANAICRIL
jgi:hypothetical protein